MYDDRRDLDIAGTAVPRRRLRKLLLMVRASLPRLSLLPYRSVIDIIIPSRAWQ